MQRIIQWGKKWLPLLEDLWLVITNPKCWTVVGTISREWDLELREMMADYKFTLVNVNQLNKKHYTAYLNPDGPGLWIQNRPYSCFFRYDKDHIKFDSNREEIPRRATMIRACYKLVNETSIGELFSD